jgi:hypothetical protein
VYPPLRLHCLIRGSDVTLKAPKNSLGPPGQEIQKPQRAIRVNRRPISDLGATVVPTTKSIPPTQHVTKSALFRTVDWWVTRISTPGLAA